MSAGVQHTSPLSFVAGEVRVRQFQEQVGAKQSFDLQRVLSFSTGDYEASSDRDLKYAQSYTLVHFLLHGLQGRHRAGFFAYLRMVYQGKGSSTDLRNALDVDWRPLEKDWDAYVRLAR
jgi:hypothetical protein